MKSVLFEYPQSAAFGRVVPKNKIYEHGKPTTAVRELFVRQVEQIAWSYKLSPETVNLPATPVVPEIQVFSLTLKSGVLKKEVLRCLDLAIPFPILFELRYKDKVQAVGAYKRPSEADGSKWVVSDHFESPWMPDGAPRISLPMALNLEALYARLLAPLMPFPARSREGLKAYVERMEKIGARRKELEKKKSRLRKTKQFNRKVEINAELRALRAELERLMA